MQYGQQPGVPPEAVSVADERQRFRDHSEAATLAAENEQLQTPLALEPTKSVGTAKNARWSSEQSNFQRRFEQRVRQKAEAADAKAQRRELQKQLTKPTPSATKSKPKKEKQKKSPDARK